MWKQHLYQMQESQLNVYYCSKYQISLFFKEINFYSARMHYIYQDFHNVTKDFYLK